MTTTTQRRFGPFQIEDQLGSGGMGTVYRAVYRKNGRQVALKLLIPGLEINDKAVKRFEREMVILEKLRHPNIVKYYGGGVHHGQYFYAMKLTTGGTLDDVLQERGQIPWQQVIEYGVQICDALEHAHDHGVIHRDLKPANLFLGKNDSIVLGDFGIARDSSETALTAAGSTVGTYAYMAPEQITGKQPVSAKTDLYALGCVLFEMLTGQTPYQAATMAELLYQHLEEEPPRVASLALDCPVWLEEIIMLLLEKEPKDRPHDAPFVRMKLEEVELRVAEQTSLTGHVATGGRSALTAQEIHPDLKKILRKKKKRKRGPIFERAWFLSSCLVAIIAFVAWSVWPVGEDELFREAQQLMASDDPVDWEDAKLRFLEPLMERFPEGQHANEAKEYLAQIEMHRLERQIMRNIRLGKEPASEAERLFVEAWNFEQFGDRVSAAENYASMAELLKDRESDQAYVSLARRQLGQIEASGTDADDRLELVNSSMLKAQDLYDNGEVKEARKIWRSITTLYSNNSEFAPQVQHAEARLDNEQLRFEIQAPNNTPSDTAN
ncbi:MAG: serine/threonine protein kinase [Planctomycetaceae bacterium]|nr:serine/threonine protein kinase [Planctomycetaceae bacterium]